MFTNESRGLQSRGLKQDKTTSKLSSEQAVESKINLTAEIRNAAKIAVREREESKVNSSWQVWSIDSSFYIPDKAQSFEEVSVISRITCKQSKEKPFPELNYSSSMSTYSLAELIYGEQPRAKRPVATNQMLENRTNELDVEEKEKLVKMVYSMQRGEQQDFNKEMEKLAEKRQWHAKNLVEKLNEYSSDRDFSSAISEVAKAMELTDNPENQKIIDQIELKYRQKLDRSKERFQRMPKLLSMKKQLLKDIENHQKLGGNDPEALDLVFDNKQSDELPLNQNLALVSAHKLAETSKPRGYKVQKVDVTFHYLVAFGWIAEISIIYEAINPKGLAVNIPSNFNITLNDLLSPLNRQPIIQNQRGDLY